MSTPSPARCATPCARRLRDWYGYLEAQLRHAAANGEITADAGQVEQLAFELIALDNEANARSLLMGSERPYDLAAAAMRDRLIAFGADPASLAALAD